MNTRLASLAVVLLIAAPAAAFAQGYGNQGYGNQSYGAPRADAPTESRSLFGMPAWVDTLRETDTATTGSIAPRRGYDSSAKGGNAAQPSRSVPQFGNTSGGPAE